MLSWLFACIFIDRDQLQTLNDGDGDGVVVDFDCDDADAAVGAPEARYADEDGDGWGTGPAEVKCPGADGRVTLWGDCDDADAAANPGGSERCGGGDEDCDGGVDEGDATDATLWYRDADNDGTGDAHEVMSACEAPAGHVAGSGDCDDASAAIGPGREEVCNTLDDDCDGEADEGPPGDAGVWSRDSDGDGWGDGTSTQRACTAPEGYVADVTDCDDSSAEVFPGAEEVCGGGDEDCDGDVDEPEAADATAWYTDADRDTFGAGGAIFACTAPPGTVATSGDCDDLSAAAHPGGTEVCGGPDEDCDGTVDEPEAADASVWRLDADLDGYGDSSATLVACTCPSGYTEDATDCNDGDPDTHPGAIEVCDDGTDQDCDATAAGCQLTGHSLGTDGDAWYTAALGAELGFGVTAVGDIDDDGVEDLAVGAIGADDEGDNAGAVYLLAGDATGFVTVGEGFSRVLGAAEDDQLGASNARAGDVTGDGLPDVALGSSYAEGTGVVYVLAGATRPLGSTVAGVITTNLYGVTSGDRAGATVAGGADGDGDGWGDLLVGANAESSNGSRAGAAYVVRGGSLATGSLADAEIVLHGTAAGTALGAEGAWVGDWDGDGVEDLYAGGTQGWIVPGDLSGVYDVDDVALAQLVPPGETGAAQNTPSDLDGDGHDDLMLGYYSVSGGAGVVHVLLGGASGVIDVATAASVTIQGDIAGQLVGRAVAAPADVDGDGSLDLFVGAPGYSTTRQEGAACLYYELASGTYLLSDADFCIVGDSYDAYMGISVEVADLDSDGYPDLVAGAFASGGFYAGAVSVFRGSGL